MQLRQYLLILQRHWPLVVALPLLVGVISLLTGLLAPERYSASSRFMVTQTLVEDVRPDEPSSLLDQWASTEFLLDDLPQVVASSQFAQDVSATARSLGLSLDPSVATGALSAETFHRTVTLRATADKPEDATALVQAAMQTLQQNGLKYWGRQDLAGKPGINVALLDPPGTASSTRSLRQLAMNVALRTALGAAAAVGLAFLMHYLDTRLRRPQDVEEWVGLPVVGVIPGDKVKDER